jgi:uncharacterized membrane protein
MSLLALKLVGFSVLIGIAISLCFCNRHVFLSEKGSISPKDARLIFSGITLMAVAVLAGVWALMASSEWQSAAYSVVPLLVLAGYGFEVFLITRLPAQWRKSPLFWMAALPPLVGCLLVMLISWREHGEDGGVPHKR